MAEETKPDGLPAGAAPAAAGVGARPPAAGAAPGAPAAHAARPAAPKPPVAIPDLSGKTTTVASPGGAAAKTAPSAPAAPATTRDPDDTSPLLTRRAWIALSWGAFSAATAA